MAILTVMDAARAATAPCQMERLFSSICKPRGPASVPYSGLESRRGMVGPTLLCALSTGRRHRP